MSILDAPYFHDEAKAYAKLESVLWPQGPECPHCGTYARFTLVEGTVAGSGLAVEVCCRACAHQWSIDA